MAVRHKFLFVSQAGLIGDIAWQIAKEGHDVRYFIGDPTCREIADGFVEKVDDWRQFVDWADVIVFDDTLGMGTHADELRKSGKKVIGGTPYTDRLEDDRSFGQQELGRAGVSTLPYWEFSDFASGVEHVRSQPGRYVIKPSGEAANIKRWLYVGDEEDGSDVIRMLQAYERTTGGRIRHYQLQRRVTGVEVAVGAFFDGKSFVTPVNYNFEHKKLFPTDIGPSTGEMGTFMFWGAPNRIFHATLAKMAPRLAAEGYVGYIDLNCIVNRDGIYPLEFTARFGYPTIFIQQEGMLTPIGQFFWELAGGASPKLRTRVGFQVGVRVVVPPYPFDDPGTFEGLSAGAAIVFRRGQPEEVHIEEVKLVNGQWVVAGPAGVVLVVVGLGSTMRQAKAQAYGRLKNIVIPNMYYRDDVGDRWQDDGDRLQAWGYLSEG
jgi:phosphoribosylamine--glycine ligase